MSGMGRRRKLVQSNTQFMYKPQIFQAHLSHINRAAPENPLLHVNNVLVYIHKVSAEKLRLGFSTEYGIFFCKIGSFFSGNNGVRRRQELRRQNVSISYHLFEMTTFVVDVLSNKFANVQTGF